ncbi:MAG: transglutaminase-like domain-containing protein, partial [Ardenticatenaceae bacterium]
RYPEWIARRYLILPETVPERVIALARDLTATEPTAYDRARAIERHLRTFPYRLDLPLPPPGREIADYFLFDLKQGYCDYYATAMVVLARAAGLPARLVVGYASGRYDPATERYVVTEAEAHSWVEIYFPEIGWIEFEPTAGRPPRPLPGEAPAVQPLSPMRVARAPFPWLHPGRHWAAALLIGLALAVTGFAIWAVVDGWRLRRLSPGATMSRLYGRLHHFARRLGMDRDAGATPYEFAGTFKHEVSNLAGRHPWHDALRPAVEEAQELTELYVQTIYSSVGPDAEGGLRALQLWQRLHRRLWLALLLKWSQWR